MNKQGKEYVENDADKWYERNNNHNQNCFTEYFIDIIPKEYIKSASVAEFGVGRGNNIRFLSSYAGQVDGYDGSTKSISNLKKLKESIINIDGKEVNLGDYFEPLRKYDVIIFGFFTYMLSHDEFKILVANSKKMLKDGGYIFMYDFLSLEITEKIDSHNDNYKVFKRNLNFYLKEMEGFDLHDFRLWDNRSLKEYLYKEKQSIIDTTINSDDYNWTFSSLFKLKNI